MAEARVQRFGAGVGRARQEGVDLALVLVLEDRAGRIQQRAARPQQGPRRIQQACLQRAQRVDVLRPPVQQHVGLATDDAGRRTRRVQQDRVERLAVPPDRRLARIGGAQLRPHADPRERFAHPLQPPCVDIHRQQAQRAIAFEQVRRLAAGGGAGIEHTRTDGGRQRIGHQLRSAVLDRHVAAGEARQRGHGHRRIDANRIGSQRRGGRDEFRQRLSQALQIIRHRHARAVDPQPQRGGFGARGENRIGLPGPVLAHALAQPRRPGLFGCGGRQAFALRAAQNRVDHPGLVRALQFPRGFHGGRERGMRRQLQRIDLGEADPQQRPQFAVAPAQRFLHPAAQGFVIADALAQRGEADRFGQRAIPRVRQARQARGQFRLERTPPVRDRIEDARGQCAHGGAGARIHAVTRSRRALR